MEPTVPAGGRVFIARELGTLARGTLVLAHFTHDEHIGIKRVVGLPGEMVDIVDGEVTIDGGRLEEPYVAGGQKTVGPKDASALPPSFRPFPVTLGQDEYLVLGDNRANSNDSRGNGPLDRSEIRGRVVGRLNGPTDLPRVAEGSTGVSCSVWAIDRGDVTTATDGSIRTDPAVTTIYRVRGDGARTLIRAGRPELDAGSSAAPAIVAFVVNLGLPADARSFEARMTQLVGTVAVVCSDTPQSTVTTPGAAAPPPASTGPLTTVTHG